jgi:hypothetical protein
MAKACCLAVVACLSQDATMYKVEEEKPQEDRSAKTQSDDKAKTIDRLVNLWVHQNTLLWSRMQTLTALQVAVLGGWYFSILATLLVAPSSLCLSHCWAFYCLC